MYFLYVMKEKGLPVGEIFEEEIKEIPTKRFSKYFDDESQGDKEKQMAKKYISMSERIFPDDKEQVVSDTTSVMNIIDGKPLQQRKYSIVPELNLDGLPPRAIHYFSDDSERSGYDLSVERKKFNENASLYQKYNLNSYGMKPKEDRIRDGEKDEEKQEPDKSSKILELGTKLFRSDSF